MPSPSSNRYLCVHGHFYQPPRENPWLEAVETQDSAAPFHDWNERVTSECYAPNGASRVLNERKKIIRIVNNYARISFNFGPTLLSWLEENAPRVYRSILDADRLGAQRFSGHGPAMAQVYNHIILPLANQHDRVTQIRWGIADFVRRFGRQPEGMWLAETAVDRDSLDLLAQHGIRFVVLAPSQCRHIRPSHSHGMCDPGQTHLPLDVQAHDAHPPSAPWQPVNAATLETRRAYRIPLDDGRSIAAFFYDGKISQAVAFENLLSSGDNFAARLLSGFSPTPAPQLVHIATDGESYGHHHRHGEMALSYALEKIESQGSARLTIYGEFLSLFPPEWEAEVNENSSWSCFHGIERWRSHCGCSSQRAGWDQLWRTPLREALDQLRDACIPLSEELAAHLLRPAHDHAGHATHDNPLWAARDAYISVVLDRSPENVDRFLSTYAKHPTDPSAQTAVLSLLELQRHALLMFTSCGWFFDDISGIETVQVLAYASRVLQLAATLFGARGEALEAPFLATLARAHSNLAEQGDAASLYRHRIRPQSVNLVQVAAHYAIRSLFPDAANPGRNGAVFAYDVHRHSHENYTSGRAQLALGQAEVRSRLTREQQMVEYAVLHFGDQNLSAAVRPVHRGGLHAFTAFASETAHAFQLGNLPEVVRLTDRAMGQASFSLHSLFADEQRRILDQLLARTLQEVETGLWNIHAQNQSLLHFLADAGMPQPPALRFVAEFVTSASLHRALETEPVNLEEVRSLLARISTAHIALDTERLRFAATQSSKRALLSVQLTARHLRSLQQESTAKTGAAAANGNAHPAFHSDNSDLSLREAAAAADLALDRALSVVEAVRLLPLEPNFWQAQNLWNQLWPEVREPSPKKPRAQKASAKEPRPRSPLERSSVERTWIDRFRDLGILMDIAVDDISVEEPAVAAVS